MKYLPLIRIILFYTLFVILWGAWVRHTGSGAGCGDHWPLCDGQVVPRSSDSAQMIEYLHRLTSGFYGILVLVMTWMYLKKPATSRIFKSGVIAVAVLTLIEALIGALLVKRGLVTDNDSMERALVIAFHLANTLFLLASIALVDFLYRHPKVRGFHLKTTDILIAIGWVLVGGFGAITALGDTLFPAESLGHGLMQYQTENIHYLIRLRVLHPILAILVSVFCLLQIRFYEGKNLILGLMILFQIAFGFLNVALLVPTWAALTHLLIADVIWILWLFWVFSNRKAEHKPTDRN